MKILTLYTCVFCFCILYDFTFYTFNTTLNIVTYFVSVTIFTTLMWDNLGLDRKNYYDDLIIKNTKNER